MSAADDERIAEAFMAPLQGLRPVTRPEAPRRRRSSLPLLCFAAVAVLAIAVGVVLVRRPVAPAPPAPATTPSTPATVQPAMITISSAGIERRDLASGTTSRLVRDEVIAAAVARDDSAIAYLAATNHGCQLGVVDLVTLQRREIALCVAKSGVQLVTETPARIDGSVYSKTTLGGIAWSPDGTRIVYACNAAGDPVASDHLCMIGRDGSRKIDLGPGFAPAFAPDGSMLAVLRDPPAKQSSRTGFALQLWIMNPDGSHRRMPARPLEDCCISHVPTLAWASDSRHVAVTGVTRTIVDVVTGNAATTHGDVATDDSYTAIPRERRSAGRWMIRVASRRSSSSPISLAGQPSGCYYDWRDRPPSRRDLDDAYLIDEIRAIHTASRETYGAVRVHDELRLGRGRRLGRKRVARLMRLVGLAGVCAQRKRRGKPAPAVHDDLVARRFVADSARPALVHRHHRAPDR